SSPTRRSSDLAQSPGKKFPAVQCSARLQQIFAWTYALVDDAANPPKPPATAKFSPCDATSILHRGAQRQTTNVHPPQKHAAISANQSLAHPPVPRIAPLLRRAATDAPFHRLRDEGPARISWYFCS